MLIFLLADTTAVSKTTKTVSPKTEPVTDKDKGQDSGSDYGGDWSEDEWNDAQVREMTLSLGGWGGGSATQCTLRVLFMIGQFNVIGPFGYC